MACRLCKIPIAAQRGCAVCHPWRSQMVLVGEDSDDAPGLAATGMEIVAGLRERLRAVRNILKADPTDVAAEKRLLALGNTAAKVLESARKLQADGVAVIETLNFVERADLFVTWYADLPPAYREMLRGKMNTWEAETAVPVATTSEN